MKNIYPIAVPKWGIEMVEGTVNSWLKQPGEAVSKGEDILEIESDKIVNVWESPADGVLRRQLVTEGEARAVGQLLGIIASAEVDDPSIDAFIANFTDAPVADDPEVQAHAPVQPSPVHGGTQNGRRASPVVRRLAQELGVDLAAIIGSGRNGRITQEDVHAAATNTTPTRPAARDGDVTITPFTATRRTIAERLVSAKQDIPHYYLDVTWEIDGLEQHRSRINEQGSSRVSLNDLLVYCVARALIAEPRVNINVVGNSIHQFKGAHVGIAIATDDGLFPATLRDADSMSPQQIATATAELVAKAKAGELSRQDISGASFTVSNLGMFGIDRFTAIINPPAGAILALGAARRQVVVRNGQPAVATVINATLSCDHRAIDGAVAAGFLAALKREIDALAG